LFNRSKILALVVLVCLPLGLLSLPQGILEVTIQEPQKAKFIISSWVFPYDEYGQGIDALSVYENSTGSWLLVGGFAPNVDHEDEGSFNWNVSIGIKIRVYSWLNSTLTGVSSTAEGKNVQRHNVTVVLTNGTVIFNQNNLTYFNAGAVGPMYEYNYDVVLNFLPECGNIYTVTVTYEIYY